MTANRVRGYDGPIEINVEGLPAGITASPATIPAGQDSTVVLLSADAKRPPIATRGIQDCRACKGEWRGSRQSRQPDAPSTLASVIPPPDAVVTAGPDHVTLEPGQDVKVTLHVDRRNGFEGAFPASCAISRPAFAWSTSV